MLLGILGATLLRNILTVNLNKAGLFEGSFFWEGGSI